MLCSPEEGAAGLRTWMTGNGSEALPSRHDRVHAPSPPEIVGASKLIFEPNPTIIFEAMPGGALPVPHNK
jgi:hypothetical protein